MNSVLHKIVRSAGLLFCLGLLAWSIFATWQYFHARRAGAAIFFAIEREWPESVVPTAGTRKRLLAAAEQMRVGDFSAAVDLQPADSISPKQRAAAQRFLGKQAELRRRFVAVVDAAQVMERDGSEVVAIRVALTHALLAAARRDRRATLSQIEIAETALAADALGQGAAGMGSGKEAVASLVSQISPSYLLGRDLLTEGHATVEKLLSRARQHYDTEEFGRAAALVRLAAELSGLDPAPRAAEDPPEWFESLDPAVPQPVPKETAKAAVNLCQSMAAATEPSAQVRTLIRNAKQELAAERFDDAFWWASVALNALGMPNDAIEASVDEDDHIQL